MTRQKGVSTCIRQDKHTHRKLVKWMRSQIQPGRGLERLSAMPVSNRSSPDTKFLDEIQTKVLRVFLPAIHSDLYSFAYRFIFLQTHASSYSFQSFFLLHTVKEKGGKPERKPYPLPYGLRNLYRNLKSEAENSQDHAQKSQRSCTFMNSASRFNPNICHNSGR